MIYIEDIKRQEYLVETLKHLLAKAKKELKENKEELLRDSYPANPILRDILS